jgi:hypothetical protein
MNDREQMLADLAHWCLHGLEPDDRLTHQQQASLCDDLLMRSWRRADTVTLRADNERLKHRSDWCGPSIATGHPEMACELCQLRAENERLREVQAGPDSCEWHARRAKTWKTAAKKYHWKEATYLDEWYKQRDKVDTLCAENERLREALEPLIRLRGLHVYWIGGEEKWNNERDLREFTMTVTKAELEAAALGGDEG